MARATAPSRRPPSAVAAAAAAPSPPARVPQRRPGIAARGALSHPKGAPSARLAAPAPAAAALPARRRAPTSCACSPTTHPGSFRCALHRAQAQAAAPSAPAPVSSRLSAPRRASMVNPLVRIAAVEGGDQIKRALAALVHLPSSSQQSPPSEGYRKIWKDTGCTIMSDGWIDKKRRTLINFLVYCPQVLERTANLANNQIINCQCEAEKWHMLI